MLSYETHNPRGWCGDPKRGAALGRPILGEGCTPAGRMTLSEVALDSGGYDRNGTYFGAGVPLWWYADESGEIDGVLRADNRPVAESRVLAMFPTAAFGSAVDDIDLNGFVQDYAAAALWSSTDNDGADLDAEHDVSDIDPEALVAMRSTCERFLRENAADVEVVIAAGATPGQVAHDLWLTRNGHGTGFWDRGYGALGDRLTDAAGRLGEANLYVGDDGKIHAEGA